ncbi:hypothetical protein ABZ883_06280 [Streptomyces sp. NPDC046977]|uniref:hypothetical protein n=1 Tax=Streptomyces sp. NPDC046977 TaxID=3154703 RepID=UPI0033C2618B
MNSRPTEPGSSAGHAPEPDPDPDPEHPAPRPAGEDRGPDGTRRPPLPPVRRLAGAAVAVVTAGALVAGLWSVPSVRTVLLQSFTRQSAPFTELYFTDMPRFDGGVLIVPIAVNAHGTGNAPLRLRMTLESADGKAVATKTVGVEPKDGRPVPVVTRFTKTSGTALLRVALVGHPQSLHYSFLAPKASKSDPSPTHPDVRD